MIHLTIIKFSMSLRALHALFNVLINLFCNIFLNCGDTSICAFTSWFKGNRLVQFAVAFEIAHSDSEDYEAVDCYHVLL